MKKLAKLMATLFLGAVITFGVTASVKAEVFYYAQGPDVYVSSTENPYVSSKVPDGTFIPAGSLVFTFGSSTLKGDVLVPDTAYILGYGSSYRTVAPTGVKYTEGAAPTLAFDAGGWNPYYCCGWYDPYCWYGYGWNPCEWNACGWNPYDAWYNPYYCGWDYNWAACPDYSGWCNPCAWNACNAGCWWW